MLPDDTSFVPVPLRSSGAILDHINLYQFSKQLDFEAYPALSLGWGGVPDTPSLNRLYASLRLCLNASRTLRRFALAPCQDDYGSGFCRVSTGSSS